VKAGGGCFSLYVFVTLFLITTFVWYQHHRATDHTDSSLLTTSYRRSKEQGCWHVLSQPDSSPCQKDARSHTGHQLLFVFRSREMTRSKAADWDTILSSHWVTSSTDDSFSSASTPTTKLTYVSYKHHVKTLTLSVDG